VKDGSEGATAGTCARERPAVGRQHAAFDERPEDGLASSGIDAELAGGLRDGQPEPWHLPELGRNTLLQMVFVGPCRDRTDLMSVITE
jgi:hypothetical protein